MKEKLTICNDHVTHVTKHYIYIYYIPMLWMGKQPTVVTHSYAMNGEVANYIKFLCYLYYGKAANLYKVQIK